MEPVRPTSFSGPNQPEPGLSVVDLAFFLRCVTHRQSSASREKVSLNSVQAVYTKEKLCKLFRRAENLRLGCSKTLREKYVEEKKRRQINRNKEE